MPPSPDGCVRIDMETWDRREHYAFFSKQYMPYINLTFRLDVTAALRFARTSKLSFYHAMIYACMRAMEGVKNFRYRIRPEGVVLLPAQRPAFTHLPEGETLFRQTAISAVSAGEDAAAFIRRAGAAARAQTVFNTIDGDDIVYFTANPWVPFTAIHRFLSDLKTDSVPKIAFGKYETRDGQTDMPFNIHVNHMLADGLHISRFLSALRAEMEAL